MRRGSCDGGRRFQQTEVLMPALRSPVLFVPFAFALGVALSVGACSAAPSGNPVGFSGGSGGGSTGPSGAGGSAGLHGSGGGDACSPGSVRTCFPGDASMVGVGI